MATHARFSPSRLEGLEQCPCFEYEDIINLDDNMETPAQRGTRLHKAVETTDLSLCLDEEERDQVQVCIDYEQSLVSAHPNGRILREQRVTVPDLTYGTLDFCLIDGADAWVTDYKFVRTLSLSTPATNFQLACYATGLLHKRPRSLQRVHATLLAPAIRFAPDPHTFTRDDIQVVEARIRSVIQAANDSFKKPTPCDMCAKCANASRCPALGRRALTVASGLGLPMPTAFAPDSIVSGRDRAVAQVLANALEQWAEQVKKANADYARNGGEVPGHTLMRRAGRTGVTNHGEAVQLAVNESLVPMSDLLNCVTLSLPKLIEAYAREHGMKKEDARDTILEKFSGFLQRGEDITYLQRQRAVAAEDILRLTEGTTE